MKVYVITSGEYSDYKIDAVTLDKEEAERMVNVFPKERIQIYDTDDFPKILTNDPYSNCEYKKVCYNCRHNIRKYNEYDNCYRWCEIFHEKMGYAKFMTGWCIHWAKERKE